MNFRFRFPGSDRPSGFNNALLTGLFVVFLAGCSSTKYVATWKEPGVGPTTLSGKKIAVFVISPQEALRRASETAMARQITSRNAEGVAGYTLMSADEARSQEVAAAKLRDLGFDAILSLHAVDKSQETTYTPGTTWVTPGYYGSWGSYWGHGWGMAYEPGYLRTTTIVTVETLIHDVATGKLIWAGRSETANPSKIEDSIKELASELEKELVRSGLLQ